jgi:hypothetical protein
MVLLREPITKRARTEHLAIHRADVPIFDPPAFPPHEKAFSDIRRKKCRHLPPMCAY